MRSFIEVTTWLPLGPGVGSTFCFGSTVGVVTFFGWVGTGVGGVGAGVGAGVSSAASFGAGLATTAALLPPLFLLLGLFLLLLPLPELVVGRLEMLGIDRRLKLVAADTACARAAATRRAAVLFARVAFEEAELAEP